MQRKWDLETSFRHLCSIKDDFMQNKLLWLRSKQFASISFVRKQCTVTRVPLLQEVNDIQTVVQEFVRGMH